MATKEVKILINARDNASNTFKKIAVAAAAAFSTRAVIGGLSDMIDSMDDVGKQAQRIGVTAEEIQKLNYAARRSGADATAVEAAFRRLSTVIYDAGNGSASAVAILDELGLSFDDLSKKSPNAQFSLVAANLNKIDDASTRAAMAQKLFGESGTKLIPMIKDLNSLMAEAERRGIISNEQIKAAEDFKDAIENIKTASKAAVAETGLVQWLADVTQGFANAIPEAKEFFKTISPVKTSGEDGLGIAGRPGTSRSRIGAEAYFGAKDRSIKEAAAAEEAKAVAKKWFEVMSEDYSGPDIVLGKKSLAEQVNAMMEALSFGKAFDNLAALQSGGARKDSPFSGMLPDRPQQAFVTRFLSGLSTTAKPAEKTASNTDATAKNTAQTVSLLGGLIEINRQMLNQTIPVLAL